MTWVVIPAYNEVKTIRAVIQSFTQFKGYQFQVLVVIDPETTDETALAARGVVVINGDEHGKGQCVNRATRYLATYLDAKSEIVFCDADVTLTPIAVQQLAMPLGEREGQAIVIPDRPSIEEWDDAEERAGFPLDLRSWGWMSGIRRVRRSLIPVDLYGYLMEYQINTRIVHSAKTWETRFIRNTGVKSLMRFTPERVKDLHAHGAYGKEKGILP
jgi:glycosyltransferase involved in cell wall biosynthesis